jgi:hypothetical protein
MLRKFVGAASAALLMTLLAGCASFPQDQLAAATLPDVSAYANKPSVYVDVKLFRGEPGAANAVDMTAAVAKDINPAIDAVLKDSQLFSSYTFDKFAQDKTDATIQLYFYNHGDAGGAAALGFISGFTFGVIPAAATDKYALQARVIGRDGAEAASYRNDDAIRTWIGIWFIPAAGNTPQKAVAEVFSNMTRDALKSMVEKKQLIYSAIERRHAATVAP